MLILDLLNIPATPENLRTALYLILFVGYTGLFSLWMAHHIEKVRRRRLRRLTRP